MGDKSVMAKAQHARDYRPLPELLRVFREEAGFTQRQLGNRLERPQSWVHNCEIANRRVDVAEFVSWAKACGVDPVVAMRRYLKTSR